MVSLIEQKFGIRLGVTAVGALLAKLNLTPQKPLQRAYQRDPEAIERWRRESFPEIARKAKAAGGEAISPGLKANAAFNSIMKHLKKDGRLAGERHLHPSKKSTAMWFYADAMVDSVAVEPL